MLQTETWFALQTRPKREKLVSHILRFKGYEEFLPLRNKTYVSGSPDRELPLFPGYVFCRYDPSLAGKIVTTPGVIRIVGFRNVPIPVDTSEIMAVKAILRSGYTAEPWEYLETGDRIRIKAGPLAGVEGILVESQKNWRVVVSITMVQRSVSVQIDRRLLSRIVAGPNHAPLLGSTPLDRGRLATSRRF